VLKSRAMTANGPFTVKEMSKMLGKSDKTVYRMLEAGKLKGYKELDTWQIFLPRYNDQLINTMDISIPSTPHVQELDSHNVDTKVVYDGRATNQSGHFVKGLFVGWALVASIVYALMMLAILDISWH